MRLLNCEVINNSWQSHLKTMITNPAQLLDTLALSPTFLPAAQRAAKLFPLRVTQSFVARMKKGDPQDPLLQQVLPIGAEEHEIKGFSTDPLGEANANPIPGLLH